MQTQLRKQKRLLRQATRSWAVWTTTLLLYVIYRTQDQIPWLSIPDPVVNREWDHVHYQPPKVALVSTNGKKDLALAALIHSADILAEQRKLVYDIYHPHGQLHDSLIPAIETITEHSNPLERIDIVVLIDCSTSRDYILNIINAAQAARQSPLQLICFETAAPSLASEYQHLKSWALQQRLSLLAPTKEIGLAIHATLPVEMRKISSIATLAPTFPSPVSRTDFSSNDKRDKEKQQNFELVIFGTDFPLKGALRNSLFDQVVWARLTRPSTEATEIFEQFAAKISESPADWGYTASSSSKGDTVLEVDPDSANVFKLIFISKSKKVMQPAFRPFSRQLASENYLYDFARISKAKMLYVPPKRLELLKSTYLDSVAIASIAKIPLLISESDSIAYGHLTGCSIPYDTTFPSVVDAVGQLFLNGTETTGELLEQQDALVEVSACEDYSSVLEANSQALLSSIEALIPSKDVEDYHEEQ